MRNDERSNPIPLEEAAISRPHASSLLTGSVMMLSISGNAVTEKFADSGARFLVLSPIYCDSFRKDDLSDYYLSRTMFADVRPEKRTAASLPHTTADTRSNYCHYYMARSSTGCLVDGSWRECERSMGLQTGQESWRARGAKANGRRHRGICHLWFLDSRMLYEHNRSLECRFSKTPHYTVTTVSRI